MLSLLVYAAPFVLGVVLALMIILAIGNFRRARTAPYFRIRRDSSNAAWRSVLIALLCAGGIYAALSARSSVPPPEVNNLLPSLNPSSATQTFDLDSVLTVIPGTPIATRDPLLSPPTITPTLPATTPPPTPFIATVEGPATASPDATIKLTAIATGITSDLGPVDPGTFFSSGISRIYFFFEYAKMTDGASWSWALILNGKAIYTETKTWNEGAAGNSYRFYQNPSGLPAGSYQVQLYIGDKLAVQGTFTLQ